MNLPTIDTAVFQAAQETAVFTPHPFGVLKISGGSRLDLINRMSTQAVNRLQAGEGAATILTSDIGRIIDRLILYATGNTVYALTGENNADFIARYLMRFVFFNDDFQLEDVSGTTAVFGVYGPQAGARLAGAGFPETDLPRHHWRQAEISGLTAYLHRADPVAGDGYFVLADAAEGAAIQSTLQEAGLTPANAADYEYLRIAAGLPRLGREMTLDYIPLEANLWADVSFNKGCYIGQEIIARMESRGKLAKRLVRLALAAPAEAGAEISAGTKSAGVLTSAAAGPDGVIGLGYVKTAVLDDQPPLTIGDISVTPLPDATHI
jgi:tRNA-modifying protein YgfZ